MAISLRSGGLSAWLLRIDNEAIPLVRQQIHSGTGSEIAG